MFDKIVIHVGLHKTGTTTIQHFLLNNRKVLSKSGIIFPVFDAGVEKIANHSWLFATVFGEDPMRYHLNVAKGYSTETALSELKQSFIKQLNSYVNNKGSVFILSAEKVSIMNQAELENIKDFFAKFLNEGGEVQIVCFIRNPVNFEISAIQEVVKGGNPAVKAVQSSISSCKGRIKRVLAKFNKVFGVKNVRVIGFENAVDSIDGLEKYFINAVAPRKIENLKVAEKKNMSLSFEAFSLLSNLGKYHARESSVVMQGSHEWRDRQLIAGLQGNKYIPEPAVLSRLIGQAQDDFNFIKETYSLKFDPISTEVVDTEKWTAETLFQLESIMRKLSLASLTCVVDVLRDYAVSIETKELAKALVIMELACKFRPKGRFIKDKINHYKRSLNS